MAMTRALQDLKVGEKARVVGFLKGDPAQKAYRQKLLAMGLTPGVVFVVNRVAPMGDPVEISLRGFALSLRKDEAATLLLESCEEDA
jgi:ferrous iron transport protein A